MRSSSRRGAAGSGAGGRTFTFAARSEAALMNWVGALAAVTESDLQEVLASGGPEYAAMAGQAAAAAAAEDGHGGGGTELDDGFYAPPDVLAAGAPHADDFYAHFEEDGGEEGGEEEEEELHAGDSVSQVMHADGRGGGRARARGSRQTLRQQRSHALPEDGEEQSSDYYGSEVHPYSHHL